MTITSYHLTVLSLVIFLLCCIGILSVLLVRSMRRTLYSYRNIMFIGGLLFSGVFTVVFAVHYLLLPQSLTLGSIYRTVLTFPGKFSYWAVFVMLAVCVLLGVSNVQLMRKEGYRLHNALSLLMAVLYVGGTLVSYWFSEGLLERLLTPLGLANHPSFIVIGFALPLFLVVMLCYFECIFAGAAILGWIAARTVPKYDKDFIIVLGCSIDKRGGLLPLLRGRVNRAIRFAWEQEIASGKPLRYIPSGGQGPNECMSEGSAMGFYLMTHGAEDYEVFPEKLSKNTWENLCFSKKIAEEMVPKPKVAFATTNYHILRSGILANRAGLDAEGIAGDTKWYFWPNGFIREFFGILAMHTQVHLSFAVLTALVCTVLSCLEYIAIIR